MNDGGIPIADRTGDFAHRPTSAIEDLKAHREAIPKSASQRPICRIEIKDVYGTCEYGDRNSLSDSAGRLSRGASVPIQNRVVVIAKAIPKVMPEFFFVMMENMFAAIEEQNRRRNAAIARHTLEHKIGRA